jgi:hypothetical protein
MWSSIIGVLGGVFRGAWKWLLLAAAVVLPVLGWWTERKKRRVAEARARTADAITDIEARRNASSQAAATVWERRYGELHDAVLRDRDEARHARERIDAHAGDVDAVAASINEALGLDAED